MNCKRTVDEKVLNGFFNLAVTENASVTFQLHISSSKCSPSVQPILQNEPEEDLMFILTLTFPKPFESSMNLEVPTQMLVSP